VNIHVIPTLERQEDHEFGASWGYIVSLVSKQPKKKNLQKRFMLWERNMGQDDFLGPV
jgi:hypothetical protein